MVSRDPFPDERPCSRVLLGTTRWRCRARRIIVRFRPSTLSTSCHGGSLTDEGLGLEAFRRQFPSSQFLVVSSVGLRLYDEVWINPFHLRFDRLIILVC